MGGVGRTMGLECFLPISILGEVGGLGYPSFFYNANADAALRMRSVPEIAPDVRPNTKNRERVASILRRGFFGSGWNRLPGLSEIHGFN